MKYLILISCISLIIGCIKEKQSTTNVVISNNTSHNVLLLPYINGNIDSSKLNELLPNTKINIENNYKRGKDEVPIVFWNYFKNIDSIVVVWDNIYHNTHMISDTFYSTNNYVQFGEVRNIGLEQSYSKEKISDSKNSRTWSVTYNFSEQDYLDAKN